MNGEMHPAAHEIELLLEEFDALAATSSVSQSIASLLDDFERVEGRGNSPGSDQDSGDAGVCDLLEDFEVCWRSYVEERAADPPNANIWHVAQLGRDEVKNCEVLHWFLDAGGTHCQGTRFLRCLLESVGEDPNISDERGLTVKREDSTSYGDSRIDLLIETDLTTVLIEAKISALEDSEQIDRYAQQVGYRARMQSKRFVGKLLTVTGHRGEEVAGGFVRILWADVALALRSFSGDEGSGAHAARSAFVRELARQYARFIDSL